MCFYIMILQSACFIYFYLQFELRYPLLVSMLRLRWVEIYLFGWFGDNKVWNLGMNILSIYFHKLHSSQLMSVTMAPLFVRSSCVAYGIASLLISIDQVEEEYTWRVLPKRLMDRSSHSAQPISLETPRPESQNQFLMFDFVY